MSGTLIQMSPVPAALYVPDHSKAYAMFGSKLSIREFAFKYSPDRCLSKFGVRVMRSNHWQHSALSRLVGGIVCIRAKKQMAWVATWRIVAMMQHAFIAFPGRMCEFVGNTVRKAGLSAPSNSAVTQDRSVSSPLPTFMRTKTVHFSPKALIILHAISLRDQLLRSNRI
jgi:hypothetical protein